MMRRQRGFTLLEVLVALAIIGIAMAAVLDSAGSHTRNAAYLQQKTYAHWVAMNRLARLQSTGKWTSEGDETSGSEELGQHEWHWTVKTVDVANEQARQAGFRRVDVEVRAEKDDEEPITVLSSYIIENENGS
jgi:general secretion pathway protein I